MPLVLVVSIASALLSASPSTGEVETRALESRVEVDTVDVRIASIDDGSDSHQPAGEEEATDPRVAVALGVTLASAFAGGVGAYLANLLVFAPLVVGLVALNPSVPIFDRGGGYLIAAMLIVDLLMYSVIVSLGAGAAIWMTSSWWKGLLVTPLIGGATFFGPFVGALAGAAIPIALAFSAAFIVNAAGVTEAFANPYLGLAVVGALVVGLMVGVGVGTVAGIVVPSIVVPPALITFLADDPSEWDPPFSFFNE